MTIKRNIEKIMQQAQNAGTDTTLGDKVRKRAVEAIKAGEGSEAWRAYMEMFAENEEQLARLLPTDDTQGIYEMDVARTYLLGNGTCGAETIGVRLLDGVDDKLDEGLSDVSVIDTDADK